MNFGLDYDGTVTGDPVTFEKIVNLLKQAGHKVYLVTMRYESELGSIHPGIAIAVDGIIPTSRQAKRKVVEDLGLKIHIWIDDNPEAVYMHAGQIWGQASPEGTIVIEDHTS